MGCSNDLDSVAATLELCDNGRLAFGAFWSGDLLIWRRLAVREPRLAAHLFPSGSQKCIGDNVWRQPSAKGRR